MKQLLQNMRDGKTIVTEVPTPRARQGTALVKVATSLVSAGTERMLVEFAGKGLLGKAQSRPDLMIQVIDKARREGLIPTLKSSLNRLDQPMVLGYSSAGTIVEVGQGLKGFKVSDRVACAGGGHAVHAEYNVVPQNLLARMPAGVDFDSAAFTTLGAIAMHGFRLAHLQIGENVAIIGLGLLGMLVVEITQAAGLVVLGIDLDPARVALATSLGIKAINRAEALDVSAGFTHNRGFDAVLICADTPDSDPVNLAGNLARDRGRVISLGVVGTELPRKLYYEKELHFQISRSSGPGRYDPDYEEKGIDYPYGFVRWSEQRNMQAFLDLLATRKIDVSSLISHKFEIQNAASAYDLITGKTKEAFLGVLLTYPQNETPSSKVNLTFQPKALQSLSKMNLGVLGAGNYATATFLPIVAKSKVNLVSIASASGVTAMQAARKYHFRSSSSDASEVISDPDINTILIMTRHNQHASQTIESLKHNRHVYCEKPLAINKRNYRRLKNSWLKRRHPF